MTSTGCKCGKRAWSSKRAADAVVIDAKIKANLRGRTHRREQRAYPCPTNPDLWHVTSQPDLTIPPALPDYPNTDDEAATGFISDALRHQNDTVWMALYGDDRVEQTARVLAALHQRLLAQGEERAAAVEAAQSRRSVGEATFADVERARADKAEWQARVVHFRAAVLARLDGARQAVKALNTARSNQSNSRDNNAHREALRRLTLAVTRHMADTDQPTAADRRLWAWLTVITAPHSDGTASLADIVAAGEWADSTQRPSAQVAS